MVRRWGRLSQAHGSHTDLCVLSVHVLRRRASRRYCRAVTGVQLPFRSPSSKCEVHLAFAYCDPRAQAARSCWSAPFRLATVLGPSDRPPTPSHYAQPATRCRASSFYTRCHPCSARHLSTDTTSHTHSLASGSHLSAHSGSVLQSNDRRNGATASTSRTLRNRASECVQASVLMMLLLSQTTRALARVAAQSFSWPCPLLARLPTSGSLNGGANPIRVELSALLSEPTRRMAAAHARTRSSTTPVLQLCRQLQAL